MSEHEPRFRSNDRRKLEIVAAEENRQNAAIGSSIRWEVAPGTQSDLRWMLVPVHAADSADPREDERP